MIDRRLESRRRLALVLILGSSGLMLAMPASAETPDGFGAQLLSEGREALHAGELEDAARTLRSALATGLEGDSLSDARFLLGKALVAKGAPAEAVEVLEAAIAAARRRDGSVLDDLLLYELAEARSAMGEHKEAARLYARVARDPWSPKVVQATAREAEAHEAAGDARLARRTYKELLDTWPDAPEQWRARAELARLEEEEGHIARAIHLDRAILRYAPDGPSARRASEALDALEARGYANANTLTEAERLDELEWFVSERRFEEAIEGLKPMLEAARTEGLESRELHVAELLATAYRGTRQHEAALGLWRWLEEHGRDVASDRKKAWALGALGRHDEAEAALGEAHGGRRSTAYWKEVGRFRAAHGRYDAAERSWRLLAKRRGAGGEVRRLLAWSILHQGRIDEALPLLSEVASTQRKYRSWARYWMARGLMKAGRSEEARMRFEALAFDEPLAYYGIQAWSRIAELMGTAPRDPRTALGDTSLIADTLSVTATAAGRSSTFHWPPSVQGAAWDHAVAPAPAEVRKRALSVFADAYGEVAVEALRAVELERLGFVEEAREELLVIDADRRELRRRGPSALVGRARSPILDNRSTRKGPGGSKIRRAGRRSGRTARTFARAAKDRRFTQRLRDAQIALGEPYAMRKQIMESGGLDRAPSHWDLDRWRQAFPIAYGDLVEEYSELHGVPPYFLYAIMTIESTFHPHPISVSDAYGLIQVIPKTGRRATRELELGEFSPERLLAPATGIYVGGHYLGRLLEQFHGQEPLAAAAYNCGPHRVMSWLEANPDRDLDQLIDEIPYDQTRRYAKRAVQYTATFRRVWHGEPHMYVSNTLTAEHLPQPNY